MSRLDPNDSCVVVFELLEPRLLLSEAVLSAVAAPAVSAIDQCEALPPPPVGPAPSTPQDAQGGAGVVIPGVPAYIWYRGCGPTSGGMVIGYWDGNGYDDFVAGDATSQTAAVNTMIASSEHYDDYSLPIDDPGTGILPDKSSTGGAHENNCVADWMQTSWSSRNNYYGWTWFSNMDAGLEGYAQSLGYTSADAWNETWGDLTWDDLVGEIDAGRPMLFLVDSDGNGNTDHIVTVIGYDADTSSYAALNTWDTNTHWYEFAQISSGQAWGIYGATFFDPDSPQPPEVVGPIADLAVDEDDPDTVIDLSLVFDDPNPGDVLTYSLSFDTPTGNLVGQISEPNYTHLHQDLLYTHTGDNRGYGPEHNLARDNIFDWFESLGLQTSLHPFQLNSQTYYNVVGVKPGTTNPDDIFIIGAHYDSLHNPGADDNGSGTAAVMEAARVLSSYEFENTVTFIAFGREEQGLVGSTAYVADHSGDNILGMVNLDMIAYNPADANQNTAKVFDWVAGGTAKQNLIDAFAAYGNGVTAVDAGQTSRSDHRPFEDQGFDSAGIAEYNVWNNPEYHLQTDAVETPGYIDYTYATNVTSAATGYLADFAVSADSTGLLTATVNADLLTLDYLAGQNGVVEITVRATDTGGLFAEDTFLVTVNPLSDDPLVAAPIDDVTVHVSAPDTVVDLSAHFADTDVILNGDWLTFSITANTNPALVTPAADAFNLTLDYEPGLDGAATVTVRATDAAGAFVEDTFLATVDPGLPQAEIIIDNDDASGVTVTGDWLVTAYRVSYFDTDYLHDKNAGKGTKNVRFTPALIADGQYEVYLWWPLAPIWATNVPVDVAHNGGTSTESVDQSQNGWQWHLVGTYNFDAGTGSVTVRTDATASHVAADAVRFLRVGDVQLLVTVDSLTTTDTTPRLTGTVNDPAATVAIEVDGTPYAATNNGDGTWVLADDMISPPLALGTYDVTATADNGGTPVTDTTTNELEIVAASTEVIVDNSDGTGVTRTGLWTTSTFHPDKRYGADYLHDGNTEKGTKSVRFTPSLAGGNYDVYLWWAQHSNRATNVPVDITHATGTATVVVDQTQPGAQWVLLGTYTFDAGTSGNVLVRTNATDGYVIADAVRFTPSSDEPAEIIIDNADGAGVTVTGAWTTSTFHADKRYGASYLHDQNTGKGTKSVEFTPTLTAGDYDVYLWWAQHSNRATNVPVDITHATGTATVVVDQTQPGAQWVLLGTHTFDAGTSGSVLIRTDGTDGYVIADAVRFMPASTDVIVDNGDAGVTVTGSWTTSTLNADKRYGANYLHDGNTDKGTKSVEFTPTLTAAGDYEVYLWWAQHSNRATNVPVDIIHSDGAGGTTTDTVIVDQTQPGAQWVLLGTYTFDAGTSGNVLIRTDGTDGYVIADAVRFVLA